MAQAKDRVEAGTHPGTNGTQRPLGESYPAPRPTSGGTRRPNTVNVSSSRG